MNLGHFGFTTSKFVQKLWMQIKKAKFHILKDTIYTDKNIYANGTRHICVKLNTKYTMVTWRVEWVVPQ